MADQDPGPYSPYGGSTIRPPVFLDVFGIVHTRGTALMSVCGGSFAQSRIKPVPETTPISCLWCLTGIVGSGRGLRWFKWADEP